MCVRLVSSAVSVSEAALKAVDSEEFGTPLICCFNSEPISQGRSWSFSNFVIFDESHDFMTDCSVTVMKAMLEEIKLCDKPLWLICCCPDY